MTPLHVDPAAIRLLAARCRAWGADLAAPTLPGCGSFPATAAAVETVHRALHTTAGSLARRMGEAAQLIEDSAGHFQTTDSTSASALGIVAIRP